MNNNRKPGQRIANFFLTKIIIGLITCMAVILAGQGGVKKLLDLTSVSPESKSLIKGVVVSIPGIAAYTILYILNEKRKSVELSLNRLAKNLVAGILLG